MIIVNVTDSKGQTTTYTCKDDLETLMMIIKTHAKKAIKVTPMP